MKKKIAHAINHLSGDMHTLSNDPRRTQQKNKKK